MKSLSKKLVLINVLLQVVNTVPPIRTATVSYVYISNNNILYIFFRFNTFYLPLTPFPLFLFNVIYLSYFISQPQFGDILVFPQGSCGMPRATNHYAIYVDDVAIPGKANGENVFHMTSIILSNIMKIIIKASYNHHSFIKLCKIHNISTDDGQTSGCKFMKWNVREITVHNYKDGEEGVNVQNQQEIIDAIANLNNNCGKWSFTNTCEHVATLIRYGQAHRQCRQVCHRNYM